MSESVELFDLFDLVLSENLGPFVLVEARPGPDGPDDLRLNVRAGNGLESDDDILSLLLLAASEMPGGAEKIEALAAEIASRP